MPGSFGMSAGESRFLRRIGHFQNPSFIFSGRKQLRSLIVRAAGTDYYSTLNVSKNATLQEIKGAYRKLARKVCCFFSWL